MAEPALQFVYFGLSSKVSRSRALMAYSLSFAFAANICNGPNRQSCPQPVAKAEALAGRSRVYRMLVIVLLALRINGPNSAYQLVEHYVWERHNQFAIYCFTL